MTRNFERVGSDDRHNLTRNCIWQTCVGPQAKAVNLRAIPTGLRVKPASKIAQDRPPGCGLIARLRGAVCRVCRSSMGQLHAPATRATAVYFSWSPICARAVSSLMVNFERNRCSVDCRVATVRACAGRVVLMCGDEVTGDQDCTPVTAIAWGPRMFAKDNCWSGCDGRHDRLARNCASCSTITRKATDT